MSKKVRDQEFAAVIALPSVERYSHFVNQVADWNEVWGLKGSDGWHLVANDAGQQMMPVWPHARYAEAWAKEGCIGAIVEAIPLDLWLTAWLPGLSLDGRGVAVFPIPSGVGVTVTIEQLAADISAACEQIER